MATDPKAPSHDLEVKLVACHTADSDNSIGPFFFGFTSMPVRVTNDGETQLHYVVGMWYTHHPTAEPHLLGFLTAKQTVDLMASLYEAHKEILTASYASAAASFEDDA